MKTHFCMNCGTEQQQVGEISDYIICERCGAKIYSDGSGSYDCSEKEKDKSSIGSEMGHDDHYLWMNRLLKSKKEWKDFTLWQKLFGEHYVGLAITIAVIILLALLII